LEESRGALDVNELDRIDFELEEDSGSAAVVLKNSCVVGDAILAGVEGGLTGSDVLCGDDVQEVLVGDEVLVCDFERIIEGLDNLGEIWAE
jgi:hypothetical protein